MPPKRPSSEKSAITSTVKPTRKKGEVPAPTRPCLIVGIGASAGSQGALEQLITIMPPDCGVSFVVVMHLPPDGPSFLAEMLRRYTTMAVVTAEEGMVLHPDTVHVIPAGRELTVSNGRLRLEEAEDLGVVHHPIDRFFRSLAAELAERTIAVVLSGFGTDGAEGVKWIKEAEGIVIVQEPESAVNPAMPNSAIATGAADLILPTEEIPAKIVEIVHGTCTITHSACRTTSLDDDLRTIFSIVKEKTGHDFSSYKVNTVMRRIERRMTVNDVRGIGKYIALLRGNSQEAHALCQDILIGVTSFFRDPEAFTTIRREVIPRLFADRNTDEPVRIWHACCATGEEAYSMAILIREYLIKQRLDTKVLIFATDIDEAALSQGRAGLYADDIEADVGEERLLAFFTKVGGRWQVAKELRDMIVFAHHSLVKDPPFSRLDLLVCRNFLIYLNADMQKRLIALFHQVLKPGGVLFLGGAETAGHNSDLFTPVDKKWKIFRRLENGRHPDMLFPFATPVRKLPITARPQRSIEILEPKPAAVAEKLLLERYAPPCVVVNDKYEVVHVSTRLNRFLELPVGEPSRDILRMAREELRPALRAAIYKAFDEQRQVVFREVRVVVDGDLVAVNVLVEPISTQPAAENLAMVVFEPTPLSAAHPTPANRDEPPGGDVTSKDTLVHQLEEQLRITHEQLKAASEQLETSHEGFLSANEELMSINEEFQSANEELQSTNEELETSKEELQALNEELATVNAELQGKVEELNLVNSDMDNLLTSSEIATLFLDRHLTIKRFTPAMAGIFNLISADIGRPFRHLAGTIDWSGLARDAETVLEQLTPIEREVTALESLRHYLMRVLPYQSTNSVIDGIVVTLIDITEHKQMEEHTEHLASFPQLNPNPVLEVDSSGNVTFFNPATKKTLERLGFGEADVNVFIPSDLDKLLGNWNRKEDSTLYREIELKERYFGETIFLTAKFEVARIYAYDITERKQMEDALKESEQRVRLKLESIISPEGDIGNLELGDIIDTRSLQLLVDDFYELTGMPMGLIDLKGKVLVGVGWQDLCTKFHRVNPETCANCIESDVQLSAGVSHGEYKIYKCKNNMWDVATPVMVGDRHFGNLFMGQFFFQDEPLDYEFFRAQARKYGFVEKEYIAALEAVPRLSKETLNTSMAFFMKLADILSKLSYSNLKLGRSLAERDALMEAMRKSEEQLRTLADSIPNLAWWANGDGYITWYNQRWYEYTGTTPEQMEGWGWQKVHDPRVLPKVLDRWQASIATGQPFEMEFPLLGADGAFRSFLTRVQPVKDSTGQVIRWFGTNTDISALKQAEVALQESEGQLKRAQEIAHLGSWDLDLVNNKLSWSDEVYRIFGLEPQEFSATYEAFLEAVHPDDRAAVDAAYSGSLREGKDSYEIEHRVVRKLSGQVRTVHEKCEHFRDAAGQIIRSVGMVHDITGRKRASQRLDLLAETAGRLLVTDTPQEVIETLCQRVMDFLDCQTFFNFLVDEKTGRLHLNACAGIPEEEIQKIEWLDYGVAVCGCAARDACRIVAEDIPNTPDPRTELVKSYGIQAYACHPLMVQGKVLGTLSFGTRTRPGFTDDELSLMKAVADQVAIAIERQQAEEALQNAHDELEQRVEERTEELASTINFLKDEIAERERAEEKILRLNRLHAVLSETDQAIVRAADRDTLFNDFCRIAVEEGGFKLSWIGLVNEETGQVAMTAAHGATDYLDNILVSGKELPTELGPTGISIREGTYYICNDFLGDPCTRPWHETGHAYGIKASASIALKLNGKAIGALSLYADKKDFFDRQHIDLLLQMGAEISFALDNLDREALRREAEQALRTETSKRLQAVEELRVREQMLMQQNRQAAMGEMIGNIAHQWRQPLNTLGLIIQELPMNYDAGMFTREHLEASVAKAKQVIYHMSQTIDDFRNFFRPDKEKVLFKANDIVAKAVSLIEGSFREQRVNIEILAEEDIFIYGYPNEYSQVILNVLINARDAFIERRANEPKTVIITLSREDDKSVLTITDNAGGIAEEIMAKIFDPYFTTKGPDKGTGVGLFMSKIIIEKNMAGRLTACNVGKGAKFRIEV
jgi:two-component system CheB/CheR fusion protein